MIQNNLKPYQQSEQAILSGLVLLKLQKINPSNITTKNDFLNKTTKAIAVENEPMLEELEKWLQLKISTINEETFFSIYNDIVNFTPRELMDHFNNTYTRSVVSPSLIDLTINSLNIKPSNTILDPTAEMNGPWLTIIKNNPQQSVFLQCIEPLEACFIYLTIRAYNATNTIITAGNVLTEPKYVKNDQLRQFDRIITLPPLNLKVPNNLINNSYNRLKYGNITSANTTWGFVSNALSSLNLTSKAAIYLSNNDLSGIASRKKVRNKIIATDKIETIIKLPTGFISGTNIEVNLVILNNNKSTKLKNNILFIDAAQPNWTQKNRLSSELTNQGQEHIDNLLKYPKNEENIAQIESIENCYETLLVNKHIIKTKTTINGQDYHINIIKLRKLPTTPLAKIAEIQRGFNTVQKNKKGDLTAKILKPSIVKKSNQIDYSNLVTINNVEDKYLLHKNDIIFTIRGTVGSSIYIGSEPKENIIINSNYVIIKPNTLVEPKWLYIYLSSLLSKYYIQEHESNTTVHQISIKDLKGLPIINLSSEKQAKIIKNYDKGNAKIQKLQEEIVSTKSTLKKSINNILMINDIFQ